MKVITDSVIYSNVTVPHPLESRKACILARADCISGELAHVVVSEKVSFTAIVPQLVSTLSIPAVLAVVV